MKWGLRLCQTDYSVIRLWCNESLCNESLRLHRSQETGKRTRGWEISRKENGLQVRRLERE